MLRVAAATLLIALVHLLEAKKKLLCLLSFVCALRMKVDDCAWLLAGLQPTLMTDEAHLFEAADGFNRRVPVCAHRF